MFSIVLTTSTDAAQADGLVGWVIDVIDALGYLGVGFLVAFENVFPPIPSEIILPFAGFHAGQGQSTLIGMVLAATVGSVIGAWILYGFAAVIGQARLQALVVRYGKWFQISEADFERTLGWFDRWSTTAVLIGRCVPLIRSLISLPAGLNRMSLIPFTIYTAIGSLIWNGLLIGAGYLLGDRWDVVEDYVGILQWMVIGAILLGIWWFIWKRFIEPRLPRRRVFNRKNKKNGGASTGDSTKTNAARSSDDTIGNAEETPS